MTRRLKQTVKNGLKSIRLAYVRRWRSFGPEALIDQLKALGLRQGDVVLVHSSFGDFEGFQGKVTDIVGALQAVVGRQGTLLMPTLPFSGTALQWARQLECFDVRRTPSRMGMITELFRRMPQVCRSVHPTHPVAAWGAQARAMIAEHHSCPTPCDRHSPYGRLLDHDGRILLLGTGIKVLTFFHCVEALLEQRLPRSPFTQEVFHLKSRDAEGRIVETHTRLFDPDMSRRRDLPLLEHRLRQDGCWHEARLGTLNLVLLNATDILQTITRLADEGSYCYRDQ